MREIFTLAISSLNVVYYWEVGLSRFPRQEELTDPDPVTRGVVPEKTQRPGDGSLGLSATKGAA